MFIVEEYDALRMFEITEEFFISLGLENLTETFWSKTIFEKPENKIVGCQPKAWDFYDGDDFR